jgi:hypothetical protein
MEHVETGIERAMPDLSARLQAIRSRLPGQLLSERIETARATYGTLYTLAEVRQKVAETLPLRIGFTRGAALEPIETYRERIPDDALLKYDDASQSGIFSKFWVATPTYRSERQVDPWIIGEIAGTEFCAVIAQWDVWKHDE